MNALEVALRSFLAARPVQFDIALVGGLAVGARTEPRFTRDVDIAVAVSSDAEAEQYVLSLRQVGYALSATVEQVTQTRLATVRLRRGGKGPIIDLLFAASGIEDEIVAAAQPLEIVERLTMDVAQVGHLIAMKLLARDDRTRPLDQADLLALSKVADDVEWARADAAVRLIEQRGFSRGRDLGTALAEWRERARG
jgi:predicted nucleotidyltransferase